MNRYILLLIISFSLSINLFGIEKEVPVLMPFNSLSDVEFVDLVDKQIDLKQINIFDMDGCSLLSYAVVQAYGNEKHNKLVQKLLESGANPNIKNRGEEGEFPLYYTSTIKDSTEVAQLLLDYNADINSKTGDGTTILMAAAENNNTALIKFLLDYKKQTVDINAQNKAGETALMKLSEQYNTDIDGIKKLIEHGSDVTIPDKEGKMFLNYYIDLIQNDAFKKEIMDLINSRKQKTKQHLMEHIPVSDLCNIILDYV